MRHLLAGAQAAEARGDKGEAIALLKRAAEVYRDSQNPIRAMKMLRHIRRLEGVVEEDDGVVPAPGGGFDDGAPETIALRSDDGEAFTAVRVRELDDSGEDARPTRVFEERGPSLAPAELDAWCSFCCRPKREVGPLVAGPTGTFICAACTGIARALLGGSAPETSARPVALPHQQTAWTRISRAGSRLALLMGPAGSGRTTLLAALAAPNVAVVDLEAPLQSLPVAARVVIAVRAEPPPPPVMIAGQPVYDTATLAAACAGLVPEPVLAQVDAVGVLPAFDPSALHALALHLGIGEGAEQLVALALKAARPAQELRALIARLSP